MRVNYSPALNAAQVVGLAQGLVSPQFRQTSLLCATYSYGLNRQTQDHPLGSKPRCVRGRMINVGEHNSWRRRRQSRVEQIFATMPPLPEATTSSPPTDALLGDTDEPEDPKKQAQAARRGLFLLATVPLVWGTYAPSVKYVYDLGDGLSPPALIFNFGCYMFSAATLAGAAWVRSVQNLSGEHIQCLAPEARGGNIQTVALIPQNAKECSTLGVFSCSPASLATLGSMLTLTCDAGSLLAGRSHSVLPVHVRIDVFIGSGSWSVKYFKLSPFVSVEDHQRSEARSM